MRTISRSTSDPSKTGNRYSGAGGTHSCIHSCRIWKMLSWASTSNRSSSQTQFLFKHVGDLCHHKNLAGPEEAPHSFFLPHTER